MTATVRLQSASRARWLAARRRGITATDAPAILGLSAWKTPLGVWLDKVQPQPEEQAYRYSKGHALEPLLAAEYARRTGARMEKPPLILAHPDHPELIASLDYLAHTPEDTHIVECKTSNQWEEWADNGLPDLYAAQVLYQLAVTGLPYGVVFADVTGRLETRRVPRDLDWEADTLPVLLRWWAEQVEANEPPPLDPYRDYSLLNRVWASDPAEETYADDAVLGSLGAFVALRDRAKEREHTMTGLRTQVREYMGTAGVLLDPTTDRKIATVTKAGALLITYKNGSTTT